MQGIFITGTDTDVGKTIVTAGLLRSLREQGIKAVSMKPVQTGAEPSGTKLIPIDLEVHLKASGLKPKRDERKWMAPYLYEPACSPHLAGRIAQCYPDIDEIVNCYAKLAKRYERVLVEGAGGVYAPIDETRTMLDLMKRLELPVLLVARRGLGTINHTLLSIEAVRAAGLRLLGVVFNETEDVDTDFIRKDNPPTVRAFSGATVLGDVDYLSNLETNPAEAWNHFDRCTPGLLKELVGVRVA